MRRPLVAALATVLLLACADDQGSVPLQAEPSVTGSPTPTASSEASSASAPAPTPTPSTPTEADPHDPTDPDRARFVAEHQPAGASSMQDVAADLDGDGTDELVFAYVQSGTRARIEVAWWTGTDYEIVFADEGGPASSIDRLGIHDVNADGAVELVTHQSGSGATASASLWRVQGEAQVERLVAVGGCHDGSHTYGAAGVRFEDRDGDGADEIEATCDDTPLAVAQWSSDTYVWQDGAYRHDRAAID